MSVVAKFAAVEAELNACVLERDAEIRGMLVAVVSGKHVYQLGEPGVAKSHLMKELHRRVQGATLFDKLMTRTTTPDELFGPLDLAQLQQGKYRTVTKGMLSEAHFATLDEIFKANSAVLNALLGILNERRFDDGSGTPVACPLISCMTASNELPQGEDLNAMFDRLHLRYVVHRIQEDANVDKLLTMGDASPVTATITLDEIHKAQAEVRKVKVGSTAIDGFKAIRAGLDKQGIRVSDRRLRNVVSIAQAEAWLSGHTEVEGGDMAILQHALWNAPEERKKVIEVVYAVSCPFMPKALDLLDLVTEQRKIAKTDAGQAGEAFKKIRNMSEEVESIAKANGATAHPQLRAVADKIKAARKEVGALIVGA